MFAVRAHTRLFWKKKESVPTRLEAAKRQSMCKVTSSVDRKNFTFFYAEF